MRYLNFSDQYHLKLWIDFFFFTNGAYILEKKDNFINFVNEAVCATSDQICMHHTDFVNFLKRFLFVLILRISLKYIT